MSLGGSKPAIFGKKVDQPELSNEYIDLDPELDQILESWRLPTNAQNGPAAIPLNYTVDLWSHGLKEADMDNGYFHVSGTVKIVVQINKNSRYLVLHTSGTQERFYLYFKALFKGLLRLSDFCFLPHENSFNFFLTTNLENHKFLLQLIHSSTRLPMNSKSTQQQYLFRKTTLRERRIHIKNINEKPTYFKIICSFKFRQKNFI